MFFAETLNQRIKISIDKLRLNKNDDCLFPYKRPKPNPTLLAEFQNVLPEFTHEQLKEMTKEDYLNKFTIKKLEKKWDRKLRLNYDISNNKFPDDYKFKGVKEAKKYIKDLLDRDIFENKKPKWNNSTKPDNATKNTKLILKNALYEANHGINNYNFSKKNSKKYLARTNSADIHSMNSYWNISNKFEEKEKNELNKELLEKSMNNTQRYWIKNDFNRKNELKYPLSSERKYIEEPKYFKIYKNPTTLVEYNYEMMKRAKKDLWHEKDKILKEEKKNNPNSSEEKINYLVEKRMSAKYKERLNILESKKNMNITDINKNRKNHWKDRELIDKMKLLEEINHVKWFDQEKTYNPDQLKREILKKLVYNKDKILREQEKIKEEKKIEKYEKLKMEELESKRTGKINKSPLHYSKYPINKHMYELNKKLQNDSNSLTINNNVNISESIFDNLDFNNNNDITKKENINKKLFLEAYRRVLLSSNKIENMKKKRTMSCKIMKRKLFDVKYIHPGIYKQFKYTTKLGKNKIKEEKFMAWSCCNNSNKKSKGCQKTIIQKEKNFGFP